MNCKPGDMARLVKSSHGKNVGLIVEVVRYVGNSFGHSDCWYCKSAWPATGTNVLGGIDISMFFDIPDAWLRPIRPPETPVTETRDEELTV